MRRARRGLAALLALPLLAAPLLPAAPASADCPGSGGFFGGGGIGAGAGSCSPGTPGGPGGPPGGGDGGGSTTTSVPSPCRYVYWLSGPGMAQYVATWTTPRIADPASWADHATDPDGGWYKPDCDPYGAGDSTPDAYDRRTRDFYTSHPVAWFTAAPPPPPVPVADLVQYVEDNRDVPLPVVSVNPAAETVVGLRTWVWPTAGLPRPVVARAESGPNWAQVAAVPGRLQLSATDATVGSCDRAPAYTPGAPDSATDCFVEFRRSSARTGTSTLRVTVVWTITLTTSDGRNEVLDNAFPRSATVPLRVAEVQSVLR